MLGSPIILGDSIFVVVGSPTSPFAIERLDFQEDVLINQEVIGNADSSSVPVLFVVSADYCDRKIFFPYNFVE